jgi:hypothetical protein
MPIQSPKFLPPSSGITLNRGFEVTLDAAPPDDEEEDPRPEGSGLRFRFAEDSA